MFAKKKKKKRRRKNAFPSFSPNRCEWEFNAKNPKEQ